MTSFDPMDRPTRPQPAAQPMATVLDKPISYRSAVILPQDTARRPAPTSAPISQPISAPTSAPISQPIAEQTSAPISQPIAEQTSAPTSQPITAPTSAPTSQPIIAPTSAPTSQPIAAPIQQPIANQVPAGVIQLEGSPIENGAKEIRGSRRVGPTDKVKLAFKETKIEDTIPFIVETTGKAVIIRLQQVAALKITLVMDTEVSRQDALDLLFQAFRLNTIGVVETDKVVMIDLLTELNKLQPITVLGPEIDVSTLSEDGTICIKVFKIENTKAQNVADQLQGNLPDYTTFNVDANSNQLILEGDIGTAKRVQRMITLLDVPAYLEVRTETFKLKYADATQISTLIQDLFAAKTVGGGGGAFFCAFVSALLPDRDFVAFDGDGAAGGCHCGLGGSVAGLAACGGRLGLRRDGDGAAGESVYGSGVAAGGGFGAASAAVGGGVGAILHPDSLVAAVSEQPALSRRGDAVCGDETGAAAAEDGRAVFEVRDVDCAGSRCAN